MHIENATQEKAICRKGVDVHMKNYIYAAIGMVVFVVCGFAFAEYMATSTPALTAEEYTLLRESRVNELFREEPGVIVVEVAGEVVNPGVYRLEAGSVIADAIEAAGGVTEYAVMENINLLEYVEYSQKIVVPSANMGIDKTEETSENNVIRININIATAQELEVLPRVGPVTAQNIIDYRERSGDFKTTRDIMRVRGIGQITFENLRDLITVD